MHNNHMIYYNVVVTCYMYTIIYIYIHMYNSTHNNTNSHNNSNSCNTERAGTGRWPADTSSVAAGGNGIVLEVI